MPIITNVADLRLLAQRRLPRALFDYIDRGAYAEITLAANRQQFAAIQLQQRVAIDVSNRSLSTQMLGRMVRMPVAIAPTGLAGLHWPDGEICGAQAAEEFGIPFTVSTLSICSIEEISAAVHEPFWFQLYIMRDRGVVRELIARAKQAKVSGLMLTLDLPIQGQRHQDLKNGLTIPPRLTLNNTLNMLSKISWLLKMRQAKNKNFGNLVGLVKDAANLNSLTAWIASQFDASLTWDDIAWIKHQWGGPLIVKGIMTVADAQAAVLAGVDALVVSNHGGRQLDGAPATITALPAIAAAVADKTAVWLDGGIQSGQDVFKALALGAHGTLIGKSWLYGLAAAGRDGVQQVLEILYKELDVTMALTGNCSINEILKQ